MGEASGYAGQRREILAAAALSAAHRHSSRAWVAITWTRDQEPAIRFVIARLIVRSKTNYSPAAALPGWWVIWRMAFGAVW